MLSESIAYMGVVLEEAQAQQYFKLLQEEIAWQHDELLIFGRKITTRRMVALYGDRDYEYNYSHSSKRALKWSTSLLQLKSLVEEKTGCAFNSCLLNYYHNGEEGMGWHSDDEKSLEEPIHIASFSLGARRRFDFRNKNTKEKESIWLDNGSLLLMKHPNQQLFQHSLPKSKKIKEARINLTFRKMKA
jgi:alkylated DNA repair dioxygenase AlkB